MSDLISRRTLLNALNKMDAEYGLSFTRNMGATVIYNAPAVDAVEVVRCNDCKWWKQNREDIGRCKHPRFSVDDDELDPVTEPNAFCSYGERKYNG